MTGYLLTAIITAAATAAIAIPVAYGLGGRNEARLWADRLKEHDRS